MRAYLWLFFSGFSSCIPGCGTVPAGRSHEGAGVLPDCRSLAWDSLRGASLGRKRRGAPQEIATGGPGLPAGDAIDIATARPALASGQPGLDQLGEVTLSRRLRDAGVPRERAHAGEAAPGMVGKRDKALHRPAQARL